MIWNNLLFKKIDKEKVTIWWLGRILFQDKCTGNAMIWQVGRSLFSKEEILKLVCFDDLEKLIIERKHTEIFRTRCLEKGLIQKEIYRERCDMMISRKFFSREWIVKSSSSHDMEKLIFKRKDTEILPIGCFGRSLFSIEKIQKTFLSDVLEEAYF